MTLPRSELVDLNQTSYYHCMTRCVRRTYLCGVDQQTGQDFSHRKAWLQERILYLSTIFAIKICAFAIMSNHYHIVLYVNESQANAWSQDEIYSRWKALFPKNAQMHKELPESRFLEKIAQWRENLMSISKFMSCLNEPIARYANAEDNCTGRFWEGRFKSQAILDEGALLATMVYVDLNPIRSKMAETPETSEFTSIYERIKDIAKSKAKNNKIDIDKARQPSKLMRFSNARNCDNENEPCIDFSLKDYLELVDDTGRVIKENKKGAISNKFSPILMRLNLNPSHWHDLIKGLEHGFYYAIGSVVSLQSFSAKYSKRNPKGVKAAKHSYLKSA
ncbi:MAG: transposase [Candidatus Berkiella sp.]